MAEGVRLELTRPFGPPVFKTGSSSSQIPSMVGVDGVAPPESKDNRFTVCPATIYGINANKALDHYL